MNNFLEKWNIFDKKIYEIIPHDKAIHFIVACVSAFVLQFIFNELFLIILIGGISVIKEYTIDKMKGHEVDWYDVIYSIAGAICGCI